MHLKCDCPVSLLKFQEIGGKIYREPEISVGSLLGESELDISERFCPVCKNRNDRGAVVCIHCGASLENYLMDEAGTTKSTEIPTKETEKIGELSIDEALVPAGGIAIYVEGTSKSNPVFLYSAEEFVIGRKVEETSEAFLDLSPIGGYHLGLSRRHALIRRSGHGYEVIDLSSSNGTWLNGKRMIPNQPYPLASGSQLRLGRMRFFVLYRPVPETK